MSAELEDLFTVAKYNQTDVIALELRLQQNGETIKYCLYYCYHRVDFGLDGG